MKKFIVLLLVITHSAMAQLQLPDLSPEATFRQDVGFTNFEFRYGRPSARGRKVFGDLVPYGKLWRTGAGRATLFKFSNPVTIQGKQIAAGVYSLATIPNQDEWVVMLNSDTSKIYGQPSEYNASHEVFRFNVPSEKSGRFYETFSIDLDLHHDDATVFLLWENTQVKFTIATGTHQKMLETIAEQLHRTDADEEIKLRSAWYYYMTNEHLDDALKIADSIIPSNDNYWPFQLKVLILERLKNYTEARKVAVLAIKNLKEKKPDWWENGVKEYEALINRFPKS